MKVFVNHPGFFLNTTATLDCWPEVSDIGYGSDKNFNVWWTIVFLDDRR